jgi:hypothetical protein
MPFVEKRDIEMMFRSLDTELVVEIFVKIILEQKILFLSKHKSLLTSFAIALTSFIFPFVWMNIFIPIIPEGMSNFLEAPFSFIMGMVLQEREEFDFSEVPEDVTIVLIDEGEVRSNVPMPRMPVKEMKTLISRLKKATQLFKRGSEDLNRQILENSDDAYNLIYIPEEDG